MVKIEVISDFRGLKQGEVFVFDKDINIIVGSNGSGKSALLSMLRGTLCPNKKTDYLANFDTAAECCKVTTDIHDVFCLDPRFDNPFSFMGDMAGFLEYGSTQSSRISQGEHNKWQLANRVISKIQKRDSSEKCLMVFDEFENGFDVQWQYKAPVFLSNMAAKFNAVVIAASHNIQTILAQEEVFDMETRSWVNESAYVAQFII